MEFLFTLPPWLNLALGGTGYAMLEWLHYRHQSGERGWGYVFASVFPSFLLLAVGTLAAVVSAVRRDKRRKLVDEQTGLESLRETAWKDFEILVAEAFRRQGYAAEYTMETGADGGVDIVLRRDGRMSLVQCKCWRKTSIGVTVAREMFGLLHDRRADHVFIVSTGEFTPDALAFARGKPMTLIHGHELWEMVKAVQKPVAQKLHVSVPIAGEAGPVSAMPQAVAIGPLCPYCAGPMTRRMAKRGASAGNAFWGCLRFPQCRGTMPVTKE